MPKSDIIRFRQQQLLLPEFDVTPANAISAISKIINIFEFVARSVPVVPAQIEISRTITNACETVISRPPVFYV